MSRPSTTLLHQPRPYRSGKLRCFSMACRDLSDGEFGDKIVLPSRALLEIQTLRIPLPLLFEIRAASSSDASTTTTTTSPTTSGGTSTQATVQYSGVLEFSAEAEQMFAPYWMMQNLLIDEGDEVYVTSALNVPKGLYCRMQPHTTEFLDVVANVGPKRLLESCMRRYSVLHVGSVIMMEYQNKRYHVNILETRPQRVISLCGDVNLEVDFAPPLDGDIMRPKSSHRPQNRVAPLLQSPVESMKNSATDSKEDLDAEPVASEESIQSTLKNTSPSATTELRMQYGRRLRDGHFVEKMANSTKWFKKARTGGAAAQEGTEASHDMQTFQGMQLTQVQQQVLLRREGKMLGWERATKDAQLLSQTRKAFACPGYHLEDKPQALDDDSEPLRKMESEKPERISNGASSLPFDVNPLAFGEEEECEFCLAFIPQANRSLHAARCQRITKYHKIRCSTCAMPVLKFAAADSHVHCSQCDYVSSSEEVKAHYTQVHSKVNCTDCGQTVAFSELAQHKAEVCPEAFKTCPLCLLSYKNSQMSKHYDQCSNRTEACEVCQRYIKVTDMEAHLLSNCRPIAQLEKETCGQSQRREGAASCIYCNLEFETKTQCQHHMNRECVVAQQFQGREVSSYRHEIMPLHGSIRRLSDVQRVKQARQPTNSPTSFASATSNRTRKDSSRSSDAKPSTFSMPMETKSVGRKQNVKPTKPLRQTSKKASVVHFEPTLLAKLSVQGNQLE